MKRAVLYLALALSVSPALAGSEADTPRDMVLLTVAGLVGKINRGPVDAKRDVLLAEQKAAFKSAFEFDRAMLLALPQATVTGQPKLALSADGVPLGIGQQGPIWLVKSGA